MQIGAPFKTELTAEHLVDRGQIVVSATGQFSDLLQRGEKLFVATERPHQDLIDDELKNEESDSLFEEVVKQVLAVSQVVLPGLTKLKVKHDHTATRSSKSEC